MPTESKIKLYKGDPTAGDDDGMLITALSPLIIGRIRVPETGYAGSAWIKLAVRCDEGYQTVEDDEIADLHAMIEIVDNDNVDKWRLVPDDGDGEPDTDAAEDWGDPFAIEEIIEDMNYIFWARVRVKSDEEAYKDSSVGIKVTAIVEEV